MRLLMLQHLMSLVADFVMYLVWRVDRIVSDPTKRPLCPLLLTQNSRLLVYQWRFLWEHDDTHDG